MFHELNMGRNFFAVKPSDTAQLKNHGIDLLDFRRRHARMAGVYRRLARIGFRRGYILKAFKQEIYAPLVKAGMQIGVKEIRHEGWQHYGPLFPELKVVLLGRDPRDLYISFYHMSRSGASGWRRPFDPPTVAAFYNEEFRRLQQMESKHPTLRVRYEDLVSEPEVLIRIKEFCSSPIPEMGRLGSFTTRYEKRKVEFEKHGGQISARSIARWRTEEDAALVADAGKFFELVPDFVRFWGYDRQEG
jgi:hypothetical protein